LFAELATDVGGLHAISQATPIVEDVERLMTLERELLVLASDGTSERNYETFVRDQIVATTTAGLATQAEWVQAWDPAAFGRLLGSVLGTRLNGVETECANTLRVVTPILRAKYLFRGRSSSKAFVPLGRVPLMLMALAGLLELVQRAGMTKVTYQTVLGLFSEFRPLIELLTVIDCPMALRPGMRIRLDWSGADDEARRYALVLKAVTAMYQRRRESQLGDILAEALDGYGAGRLDFLNRLSRRLLPLLVPWRAPGRRVLWTVGDVQQLAIAACSERALLRLSGRSRSSA
jgi:hypothetical protein